MSRLTSRVAGGPCPSDMGDAMTYAETSKLKPNVIRLWNHRLPHLQRRWATRPQANARAARRLRHSPESTSMNTMHDLSKKAVLFALVVPIAAWAGCSRYVDPNVPEPIRPFVEPARGGKYLLYRPSSYDRRQSWPLVVVCHGPFPDSPDRQLRSWTELAEEKGFLVLAPRLTGNKTGLGTKAAAQINRLREDERNILACVHHLRAGHNLSDDRILIHGWGGGALAALFAGIKHSDLFRAVALTRPKFSSGLLAGAADHLDKHQPIYVNYSVGDALTGKHAGRCIDWLNSKGANLTEDTAGLAHHPRPDPSVSRSSLTFFERVLREQPWIHIRAFPTGAGEKLEFQFKLRCSFTPKRYLWDFGDGKRSPIETPVHSYVAPGSYVVTLTVEDPGGDSHTRTRVLNVS